MNFAKLFMNEKYLRILLMFLWGWGIGDGGWGIGNWELGPIPNPQSPIPNPHFFYI